MKHPWYWSRLQHKLWTKQRENGELAFWKGHVLFWTTFMFVINGIFPMLLGFPYEAEKTFGQLLISFSIWLVAGFLYGKLSWYFGENLYNKHSG
jgi:hypothetical protein